MVEPQIVVLVVAGSSPVGHPISEIRGQRPEIKSQILIPEISEICLSVLAINEQNLARLISRLPIFA